MKQIIISIFSFFTLFSGYAQENSKLIQILSGDSVILTINSPNSILWQKSIDKSAWQNITGETKTTYRFLPEATSYYRAQLSGLSCGTVYSDTISVPVLVKSPETLSLPELTNLYQQCFVTQRLWYGKELGVLFSEYATDIFFNGAGTSGIIQYTGFGTYKFDSNNLPFVGGLWNELYKGVMNCNAFISQVKKSSLTQAEKTKMEAEVRFLKALYQWHIVEIWGGTLNLTGFEPIKPTERSIVPVDTFYNQIFRDLTFALNNLPISVASNTNISKLAVEALLARAYLTKGNYDLALQYALNIINSGYYHFLPSYSDIWDINNRQNKEVIYAIDYTPNPDPATDYYNYYKQYNPGSFYMNGGGNYTHLPWVMNYSVLPGLTRNTEYGRPYNRLIPTRFFVELFNDALDQRFNGSFQNTWKCNNVTSAPKWPSSVYINGVATTVSASKVNTRRFALGDTAYFITKNYPVAAKAYLTSSPSAGQAIHPTKGYAIWDMNDLYNIDGTVTSFSAGKYAFAYVKKFNDSTRANYNEVFSTRNAYVFRYAEILLIAAEASYKLGLSNDAYQKYLLPFANARSINGNGTQLLSAYGINSGTDISIDYILDERARELGGEFLRWFDLKRTGKLVERVQHNPDAKLTVKSFHNLRPIPIDFIQPDCQAIVVQNPGY